MVLRRLGTLGVLVTWIGVGFVLMVFAGLPAGPALLVAALITVTCPTVVALMLRRLAIKPPVSTILHWEGVLVPAAGGIGLVITAYEQRTHPGQLQVISSEELTPTRYRELREP